MCLFFPGYLDLLCWIFLRGIPTNSSTQQMDRADFLDRYYHAPLNLDFASDCQLKGREREEGLRAISSLAVSCLFLLRTLWILFSTIISLSHLQKATTKWRETLLGFKTTLFRVSLSVHPSLLFPSLQSTVLGICNVPQQSQPTSLHKKCLLLTPVPVANRATAELGGCAGSLLWHCHKAFQYFGLVPPSYKTPIHWIFYGRDCNLGTGESSKSHILEIVGSWAPGKLKIEQLVLLLDDSLLGSQGMELRDSLGQVWALLKLCQSHSLSTKYFNITELANSNEKNISAHFSLPGKRPSLLEQALW